MEGRSSSGGRDGTDSGCGRILFPGRVMSFIARRIYRLFSLRESVGGGGVSTLVSRGESLIACASVSLLSD